MVCSTGADSDAIDSDDDDDADDDDDDDTPSQISHLPQFLSASIQLASTEYLVTFFRA